MLIAIMQCPYYFSPSDAVSFSKFENLVYLLGKNFGLTDSVVVTDSPSVCFKNELSGDETGFEKNWITDGWMFEMRLRFLVCFAFFLWVLRAITPILLRIKVYLQGMHTALVLSSVTFLSHCVADVFIYLTAHIFGHLSLYVYMMYVYLKLHIND